MELTFSVTLPDELAGELKAAACGSECTAVEFIGEVLEAALASRRLPHVSAGRNGAQLNQKRVENALDARPMLAERRVVAADEWYEDGYELPQNIRSFLPRDVPADELRGLDAVADIT